MGKLEKILVLFLFVSLLISLAAAFWIPYAEDEPPVRSISVILNETSDEHWGKFEKGLEQAAQVYNADVNFLALYQKDDVSEQVRLMEYEVQNGAEALIVMPAGKEELEQALEEAEISVPVILVEGRVDSLSVSRVVSADQEAMGYALGLAMEEDGISECIIYRGMGEQSFIRERLSGLMRALEEAGIAYTMAKEEPETYLWGRSEAVAALSEELTQELCEENFLKNYGQKVYGIGSSNRLLEYLDNGQAEFLLAVNSFDEGYLSLQAAIEQIEGKKGSETEPLEYYGIRKELMYEERYQRLLFPLS